MALETPTKVSLGIARRPGCPGRTLPGGPVRELSAPTDTLGERQGAPGDTQPPFWGHQARGSPEGSPAPEAGPNRRWSRGTSPGCAEPGRRRIVCRGLCAGWWGSPIGREVRVSDETRRYGCWLERRANSTYPIDASPSLSYLPVRGWSAFAGALGTTAALSRALCPSSLLTSQYLLSPADRLEQLGRCSGEARRDSQVRVGRKPA